MAEKRLFYTSKSCSSILPAIEVRKISSEYQSERVVVVDSTEVVKSSFHT